MILKGYFITSYRKAKRCKNLFRRENLTLGDSKIAALLKYAHPFVPLNPRSLPPLTLGTLLLERLPSGLNIIIRSFHHLGCNSFVGDGCNSFVGAGA
jgi:hypothetical protein